MAIASRKRRKKKAAPKKSRARKAVRKKSVKRSRESVTKRKAARRAKSTRKPAKKKVAKRVPARSDETWPMIFAAALVLLVGLIAVWQFGGAMMAANAAAYLPIPTATELLLLNDYGCGDARLAETWLMAAHPSLVPSVW